MTLFVPFEVLIETTHSALEADRVYYDKQSGDLRSSHIPKVASADVDDDLLADLAIAADRSRMSHYAKAITAIINARAGTMRAVPNQWAASEMIIALLNQQAIDGWVYVDTAFGHVQPLLVIDIDGRDGYGLSDLKVSGLVDRPAGHSGLPETFAESIQQVDLDLRHVTGRRPELILRKAGVRPETPELKADYQAALSSLAGLMSRGPGARLKVTGTVILTHGNGYSVSHQPTIVEDLTTVLDTKDHVDTEPMGEDDPRSVSTGHVPWDGLSPAPRLLAFEVFAPSYDVPMVAHVKDTRLHTYDEQIADRLVLPASHSRLLNVLTSDLTSFIGDSVEGKSAGNMILCKGAPGVGKTLTAEVYSEILHRPLYSVDLSVLSKKRADVITIADGLREVFDRVRRWDAVLLIDEADVLLSARGNDLQRNAITAEFLRVLEQFDRLTFLTTNRPNDIDDAILSRCAAVIGYEPPTGSDAFRVWSTLAKIHDKELGNDLIGELVDTFPGIAPRDIRQLLRLAVQVASHESRPLDRDLFVECSAFRGLTPVVVAAGMEAAR